MWCAVSDATILQIQADIQAGRLDTAEAEIKTALRDNPQDGGLYNLRGIIHANLNKIDEASDDFERAIQLSPRLTSAYLNFGRTCELRSASNPAALHRAIAQYRKLLKLDPIAHTVRLQLAKLLETRGDYAGSLQEISRLTDTDRISALALSLQYADLAALGRNDEADQAGQTLTRASDLDEDVIESILPILLNSRNDSVLIQLLTTLAQHQSLSTANLQRLAAAYERRGKIAEARLNLEKVASAEPADPGPLLHLARLAQKQNDLKGALGYLAHARDLKPDEASVHFFFGVVCIELDLPLEAKKSLQRALELDPNNAIYNYARGSVELQGRSAWDAIPYFQKFVSAQPNDRRGHFALGVAEFASKDYDSSANEMKLALDSSETRAGAEYFLGRIAKAEADWNAAAEHFQRSIEAEPGYAESHAEFGAARMHLGDLAGARKELDRALALNPDSYIANGNLLALLQRTKDPRASFQEERLHQLDAERSEKQELLLRTIRINPYANQ
jgi:tetratricopeptide (TPR) repeat protein